MKNTKLLASFFLALFSFTFFSSCSKDDVAEMLKKKDNETITTPITTFSVNGVTGTFDGNNIAIVLPFGTNITSLAPAISLLGGLSISPAPSVTQDFSNGPVAYTVTFADGSTKIFNVSATAAAAVSSEKLITAFSINGTAGTINVTAGTIAVTVPFGTDYTNIRPTVAVSAFATVSPASNANTNFANPVDYIVTAENGTTKTYTVTVTVAQAQASSAKLITSFSITYNNGAANVAGIITGTNATSSTIAIALPAGTSKTALVPTIAISANSTVNPSSGSTVNFTNPVPFTVEAQDGSRKTYTVTVTVTPPPPVDINLITSFVVSGQIGSSVITNSTDGSGNDDVGTIAVTIPTGATKIIDPIPYPTPSSGAIYTDTTSPTTSHLGDFRNPRTYTVQQRTGSSRPVRSYTVTVTIAIGT
ncbi:MAG: DUF5018 domain-containing protein, partial [Solirubrobacteraceae bacterium]